MIAIDSYGWQALGVLTILVLALILTAVLMKERR